MSDAQATNVTGTRRVPKPVNEPVKSFTAPAIVHERGRQPVKQLGMRGRFALRPKVFAGTDDANPKVALPDAVDDGTGRGGRVAIHQPFRECQSCGLSAFPGSVMW